MSFIDVYSIAPIVSWHFFIIPPLPSTKPGALDILQILGASETPLAPSVAKAGLICGVLKFHQPCNFWAVFASFSDKLTVNEGSIVCM